MSVFVEKNLLKADKNLSAFPSVFDKLMFTFL